MTKLVFAQRLEQVQEYYFSKKLREVAQMREQGHRILNMGIGSPDLAPHQQVIEALQQSLDQENSHQYQSYQGLPELRQAAANFYQRFYGVQLDPSQHILPLMGSKEGIMHISMALLNPGDQVLIPNPGYPTYASVTKIVEAEPVFYDLEASRNWQPNFDALEAMDTTRVKLMWVNYPHMPTGALNQKETYQKLVEWTSRRGIVLVNDNPYSFILNENPQSILSPDNLQEHVLELNSLSKSSNMAGWRIGFVCGAQPLINAVLKVKSNMDSGMFYGLQKGAIAALGLGQDWYDKLNEVYRKRRAKMWQLAEVLGLSYDTKAVGMFVWARLNEKHPDPETFIDELLHKHHIFITPGTIFGSQGQGYVRFSLCVTEALIEEALNRLQS